VCNVDDVLCETANIISPGPYDEIMYIPGWYETAALGENGKVRRRKDTRITRIYVSTEASIYNGECLRGMS